MELVTAAIIQRDGCVLLGRRPPQAKLSGAWEFPGGKVEAGETPEQCLIRELREELRITVKIVEPFLETHHHYDHGSFRILSFRTEWISGELDPQVHDRVEWVRLSEIEKYPLLPADVPISLALQSPPPS
jgi:8-oxo-dGTP diphosphatase